MTDSHHQIRFYNWNIVENGINTINQPINNDNWESDPIQKIYVNLTKSVDSENEVNVRWYMPVDPVWWA